MNTMQNITQQRLFNQHLAGAAFEKIDDVVQWLGAVQSQDYAAAQWAMGLRLQDATADAVEQALAAGSILRTHVMRPTWHFVAPADIRWLLALTAPRVHAVNASYYRKLALDDAVFTRSNAVMVRALEGGKQLTRTELVAILKQAGIVTDNLGFILLLMHAELDGVICSGARRGKQFTYALLEERVPQTRELAREEALLELTRRYFTSHGPATMQDFAWWSGLAIADVKIGLELAKPHLLQEEIDGQSYWFAPASSPTTTVASPAVYLLPAFDEYTVAYTDRSAILHPMYTEQTAYALNPVIVLDGCIAGTWKRTHKKDTIYMELSLFVDLNEAEMHALTGATQRYGVFYNKSIDCSYSTNQLPALE